MGTVCFRHWIQLQLYPAEFRQFQRKQNSWARHPASFSKQMGFLCSGYPAIHHPHICQHLCWKPFLHTGLQNCHQRGCQRGHQPHDMRWPGQSCSVHLVMSICCGKQWMGHLQGHTIFKTNSVGKDFCPAMRMGSLRRFKRYPRTSMWVSSQLSFTIASWFMRVGYCLNLLDKPLFMVGTKYLLTEFSIHDRLERYL